MIDDPIITITDIRRVYCVDKTRTWFKSHGLDFRDFLKNGLPASVLIAKGDVALIDRIIQAKIAAEKHGKE